MLTEPLIAQAMRGRSHRPLCLIDIAVPRDIDPAVRSIAGVSLIDIDKLEEPVHDTLVHRQQAVPLVERIIEAHVDAFERWYAADVGQPVVPSLGRMAEALREAELERLFARCPDLDRRQRTLVIGLSLRICRSCSIRSYRACAAPETTRPNGRREPGSSRRRSASLM